MIRTLSKKEDYRLRKSSKFMLFFVFSVFINLSVHAQRAPIDVYLIIDGSASLASVKNEVNAWISGRLDQILTDGDMVTVWSAGPQSKVIYTGKIEGAPGKEAVKKSISDLVPAGNRPDFSGALRDAASRRNSSYSYTLLISASPAALTSLLLSPQANLLRFSRIEEFPDWRALVVGLNLDEKIKKSATAYFSK
jgi:hypothetical protein